MTNLLKQFERLKRLKPRKRGWDEVPTSVVFLLALVCSAEAGFYGLLLKRFAPQYIELSSLPEAWTSGSFLLAGVLLAVAGVQLFVWGLAAAEVTAILKPRLRLLSSKPAPTAS